MKQRPRAFDLVLSYPQWQGSGRAENLRRGADATTKVCAEFGPMSEVKDLGHGENRHGVNRWTAILGQFEEAQSLLQEHQPRRVLTAGGDCACDIAVIDYLLGIYPDLTVVWIDAHLDANTPSTSPSGNFHGMPVAMILGHGAEELLPTMSGPLPPKQFRYVSAHVGDDGDWHLQRDQQLTWLQPGERLEGPIHIYFDLDSLAPSDFPHVAYPDGNLTAEGALKLVREIAAPGNVVGLTITEFSPVDDAAARTGSEFLHQLCAAAVGA